MSENDPFLGNFQVKASIQAGSRVAVPLEKLKPYLDHHGLTSTKDPITVEVKRMGPGTTDISNDFMLVVIEVELVDNGDPAIDGKLMCIGFGDLVHQVGK